MLALCILLSMAMAIQTEMEGFIVGGSFADINEFPHSAYLLISCTYDQTLKVNWRCGASILNQRILLTAAHCVHACNMTTRIMINMGNDHRENGLRRFSSGYLIHDKFDPDTLICDIAMVKISRPLKFSSRISRVAILQSPPYREPAIVAGWGMVDEKHKTQSLFLNKLNQKVIKYSECQQIFGEQMPIGTICAISDTEEGFVAIGDSGAGLLVRGYIQIGIASFKVPSKAENVLIYTDVGFFYEWITFNAQWLYCNLD